MSGFDISPYVDNETGEDADTCGLVFTDVDGETEWVMDSVELTRAQAFELAAWAEGFGLNSWDDIDAAFLEALDGRARTMEREGRLQAALTRSHRGPGPAPDVHIATTQRQPGVRRGVELFERLQVTRILNAGREARLTGGTSSLRAGWMRWGLNPGWDDAALRISDDSPAFAPVIEAVGPRCILALRVDAEGRVQEVAARGAERTLKGREAMALLDAWGRSAERVYGPSGQLEPEGGGFAFIELFGVPEPYARFLHATRRWGVGDALLADAEAFVRVTGPEDEVLELFWGSTGGPRPELLFVREADEERILGIRVAARRVTGHAWFAPEFKVLARPPWSPESVEAKLQRWASWESVEDVLYR
ncbi:MAG: hypothetical protein H6740_15115 [Alphaproteobacteria bacterium]|nr:hypothetical protein [Alphaproteobacteria bacterium]